MKLEIKCSKSIYKLTIVGMARKVLRLPDLNQKCVLTSNRSGMKTDMAKLSSGPELKDEIENSPKKVIKKSTQKCAD